MTNKFDVRREIVETLERNVETLERDRDRLSARIAHDYEALNRLRYSLALHIASARGCVPPVPCGQRAGAHGTDLPCTCLQRALAIERGEDYELDEWEEGHPNAI